MPKTHPFMSYAFRPFFLLNGLFAIATISVWLMALHGIGLAPIPATMLYWHGHEMVVGFAMAAMAGFVLTAVATWTDRSPLQGKLLGMLVFSWLLGRLAMMAATQLPYWVIASIDTIFPFLLAFLVGREVVGGGSRRNYPIVGIITILAVLNLLYHLGAIQMLAGMDRLALFLMIHLILLMITVIAGRIIPNFTANWLRAKGDERLPENHPLTDGITVVATLATGVSVSLTPFGPVTGNPRTGGGAVPCCPSCPLARTGDHIRTAVVCPARSLPMAAGGLRPYGAGRLWSRLSWHCSTACSDHGRYRQHDPGRDQSCCTGAHRAFAPRTAAYRNFLCNLERRCGRTGTGSRLTRACMLQ